MVETLVELKRVKSMFYWKMKKCPACGKTHHFAAGPCTEDPKSFLGLRQIPCGPGAVTLIETRAVEAAFSNG